MALPDDVYTKQRIMEIIAKYTPVLLLQRHTFEVRCGVENKDSVAECVFNYPYLNVTIKYGDKCVEKFKNGEDLAPYIVHEMCHVITDPLYAKAISRYVGQDEIRDERENLTDMICNIVLKTGGRRIK